MILIGNLAKMDTNVDGQEIKDQMCCTSALNVIIDADKISKKRDVS